MQINRFRKRVLSILVVGLFSSLCMTQIIFAEEKGSSLYTPYALESFDYPDLVGNSLPLQNPDYGNWTYEGDAEPVTKITKKDSRTYVELLKDPSKETGILGKSVTVAEPYKVYFEFDAKFPNAGKGTTQSDVLIGLYHGEEDRHLLGGIKVTGSEPYFSYNAGTEVAMAKDLEGNPIFVDPSKWYKVIMHMNFSGDTGTYHIRILEDAREIFNKGNIPLHLSGNGIENSINFISFANNSSEDPVYIDSVLLRNGIAVNEDFESYDLGPVNGDGWSPLPDPDSNITLKYASDDSGNQFIELTNPENGKDFNTRLYFLEEGINLTTDQVVVEFDYKANKSGRREFRILKSDFGFTSVKMAMNNGTIYLQPAGVPDIPVVKGKDYDENKWYHFKFVINFPGRFYDFYLDHSTEPAASGVNFATGDSMSDLLPTVDDPTKNVGLFFLETKRNSGTVALDNIKIYPLEQSAYEDLTTADIPGLQEVLITSDDKSEKSDALYKLKQIGSKEILPALQIALGDNQRGVRLTAQRILGYFGKGVNEEILEVLLNPGSNYYAREAIINHLLNNGLSKADIAEQAAQQLQNSDAEAKKAAAVVLGELRSYAKNTVPVLLRELQNESNDLQTRLTVLDALWNIDEKVIPVMAWTLALHPEAEHFYQLMNKAHEVLKDAGDGAVSALVNALASSDNQVKARAASLLGEIGADANEAIGDLISAMQDDVWYVSWEARHALLKIAPEDPEVKLALAVVPEKKAPPVPKHPVSLEQIDGQFIVDNGVITVKLGGDGKVTSFIRNEDGIDLYNNAGQYWTSDGIFYGASQGDAPEPVFEVVKQTEDMVELSFKRFAGDSNPFSLDIRYVIRSGEAGYHYYVIVGKDTAYPDAYIKQIATKIRMDPFIFNYRIFANGLQGYMISPEELLAAADSTIMNATHRLPNGDIEAKYNWKNYHLPTSGTFGFLGDNKGLWIVMPAADSGGNVLQNQFGAGHQTDVDPVLIHNVDEGFFARERKYLTDDRVLGPYFVYPNSGENHTEMWVDAKRKVEEMKSQWPYEWVTSPIYIQERGSITGQIVDDNGDPVQNAHIILSMPDPAGDISWQSPFGPNYYNTQTSSDGTFEIAKVAKGNYTLYAFVDGVYGEIRKGNISIQDGETLDVGTLTLIARKEGDLVWQIGIPDRSGKEFKGGNNPRVYDKFLRYSEFFPNDVHYTVGESDPGEDFFFWHPAETLDGKNPVYNIEFEMNDVPQGEAVLTIGVASTRGDAKLTVNVNGTEVETISFNYDDDTGAMLRGAMYGVYRQWVLRFDTSLLELGSNTLTLTLKGGDWLKYVGYDFLRLEIADGDRLDLFSDMKARWTEDDGNSGIDYDPNAKVTRAEFVAMMTKAAGLYPIDYLGAYDDVIGDEWFAGAVQSGRYKQLIPFEMTLDNEFDPNAFITREEMAALVMKAYEYRLKSLPKDDLSVFSDRDSIAGWAKDYVKAGVATGIVTGQSDTLFAPQEEVSRTEALNTVHRLNSAFPWLAPIELVVASPESLSDLLTNYENNNDVTGPLRSQLSNSLRQAQHHYERGAKGQTIHFLEKFLQHLNNKRTSISDGVYFTLRGYANELIQNLLLQ